MKHIKIFEAFEVKSPKDDFTILDVFTHYNYNEFYSENKDGIDLKDVFGFISEERWKREVKEGYLLVLIVDEMLGEMIGVIMDENFKVKIRALCDGGWFILNPELQSGIQNKISGPSGNDFYRILDDRLPEEQAEKLVDRLVNRSDLNLISHIQKSAPKLWRRIQDKMGSDKADTAADLGDLGF